MTTANEIEKIGKNEIEGVTGGTCFTAGTRDQDRLWSCRNDCKNSYRTGKEEERNFFIFWSRHMREYYCPDCKSYWWKHED